MLEGEKLLQAVRNRLRKNLTFSGISTTAKKQSIQIMPDQMVPPMSGEEFIGIYGGDLKNLYPVPGNSTKESYGISVGITRRVSAQPVDRLGDTTYTQDLKVYNRTKPSMLKRARQIMTLIDGIWQVVEDANTLIDSDGCPFITPLGLVTADIQPKYVDENHFFTDPDSNKFHKGLFMEISFAGAEILVVH